MLAEEGTMVGGVAITEELRDGSGSKMPPVLEKESMPAAAGKALSQHLRSGRQQRGVRQLQGGAAATRGATAARMRGGNDGRDTESGGIWVERREGWCRWEMTPMGSRGSLQRLPGAGL